MVWVYRLCTGIDLGQVLPIYENSLRKIIANPRAGRPSLCFRSRPCYIFASDLAATRSGQTLSLPANRDFEYI
jgi:hypothetical protein